jgi:ankyrin repeat protein
MFIRFLISRGVDVNCPSGSGLSPLGFTVLANADIKLMRMLLESGADPCVNDPLGTPLGHLLFASYVLGNGSYTAEKYRDVLKLLLEHGLDPNSTNRPGRTLLNGAIHLGKTRGLHVSMETARLLLQHGADVNAKDPDGMTPLHRLLVAGSESVPATAALAKLLIQNGAEPGADLEVSRLFRELRDIWPRPPSSAA